MENVMNLVIPQQKVISSIHSLEFLTLDIQNKRCDFSNFDFCVFQGMPTHDAKGEELPKSQIKKLQKLYTKQEETYKKFQNES